MTTPRTILYRGGAVYGSDDGATALLVAGDRIGWVGRDAGAPAADLVVDLDGALVTPAFVDAHVHATSTGLALLGLDLSEVGSADGMLAAVAGYAATLPADAVVLGHGWDESGWSVPAPPTAGQVDRAAGGRRVYLSQASVHSAVVSSALLGEARGVAGFDESGWLRRDAHHEVRRVALATVGAGQRRAAQVAALRRAASLGIAAVHECAGPTISSADDLTGLLALAAGGGLPEVYGYWGELGGVVKARELGAVGAAGDLFADGAFGSHTAHLREPYRDRDTSGHGYLTREQVAGHLVECVAEGAQGGFHAIGDAALEAVLGGFADAAEAVGVEKLRAGRHRVEHAELLDGVMIADMARYGVVASVQPAFDRLWGGVDGMYGQRLGRERASRTNPLGLLAVAGVPLAFGSDSPVTPLDPWGTVRAAVMAHNAGYRMELSAAFAAHTRGGWWAAGRDGEGALGAGWPATFAVWDVPVGGGLTGGLPTLFAAGPDEPAPALPVCRRTVLRGEVIYDVEET
jgi:predicted amidohydrolase YtcJ